MPNPFTSPFTRAAKYLDASNERLDKRVLNLFAISSADASAVHISNRLKDWQHPYSMFRIKQSLGRLMKRGYLSRDDQQLGCMVRYFITSAGRAAWKVETFTLFHGSKAS